MKTYTFEERRPKIPGPWMDEPDKAQWIDTVTGLDCLIVRNHMGGLCGYVGVQPGHKWHGKQYDELGEHPDVHGGLTFSEFCAEGEGVEDGPYICHIPEPGRPENVWWLGFDCGHFNDLMPGMEQFKGEMLKTLDDVQKILDTEIESWHKPKYRTFDYVKGECARLAFQIQQAA